MESTDWNGDNRVEENYRMKWIYQHQLGNTFMLSMMFSSFFLISLMVAYTIAGCREASAKAPSAVQMVCGATPAAMATSVVVHCWPPKHRAFEVSL